MKIVNAGRDGINFIRASHSRYKRASKAAIKTAEQHDEMLVSEVDKKTQERFDAYMLEFAMKETE